MTFLRGEKDQIAGIVGSTRDISLRKDLEREVSAAVVQEQQRIGQELHDRLGQELLGLGLMARSLEKTLGTKALPEAESAGGLVQVAKDAYDHVRAMIKGVRPVEVDATGLMAALTDLANSKQHAAACGRSMYFRVPRIDSCRGQLYGNALVPHRPGSPTLTSKGCST